jgi:hypothetical protein
MLGYCRIITVYEVAKFVAKTELSPINV